MGDEWIPVAYFLISALAAFGGAWLKGRVVEKKVDNINHALTDVKFEINSRLSTLIEAMIAAAILKDRLQVADDKATEEKLRTK